MPRYIAAVKMLLTCVVLTACSTLPESQKLNYRSITVESPEYTMEYGVYTPPNWTKDESLPLVVFLHGAKDNHFGFEKFKAHDYLDAQINAGLMPRFILVTPNGKNGFWENWYDGTHFYRDWVLEEVMPSVQKEFNTRPCPEHCHLAGISMGGFGVLRFAFFAKERFSSVSAISAPILNEEENKQAKKSLLVRLLFPLGRIFGPNFSENYSHQKIEKVWLEDEELQKIRLQLIVGDDDRKQIMKANARFHALLEENRIDHDYYIFKGGHQWKSWIPNFNRVFNFLIQDNKPQLSSAVRAD